MTQMAPEVQEELSSAFLHEMAWFRKEKKDVY